MRTQCPAVHRDMEAQNGQQIQLNLFNHKTFVFFCSHSGHLFLNSSIHCRYERGAEIKVVSDSSPPFLPLRHSNLSHSQVFDCNFLVFEIDVFHLFFHWDLGQPTETLIRARSQVNLQLQKTPIATLNLNPSLLWTSCLPSPHHSIQLSCSLVLFRWSPLISAALVSTVIPLFNRFNSKPH